MAPSSAVAQSNGEIPKGRNGHSSTVINDKMYVVGGWLGTGSYASDEVFELDLITYTWRKVTLEGKGIGPLNMHSAENYEGKIIIFR